MRYHYESGYKNFKASQRTYIRSSWKRRLAFHFSMWGGLLLGMLIFVIGVITFPVGALRATVAGAGGGLIGVGLLSLLSRPWQVRRMYRLMNGKEKHIHAYISIEDQTLVSGIEGHMEGRFQRSSICEVAEDDSIILLFVSPKRFLYIPPLSLHETAIQDIHRWLELPKGNT